MPMPRVPTRDNSPIPGTTPNSDEDDSLSILRAARTRSSVFPANMEDEEEEGESRLLVAAEVHSKLHSDQLTEEDEEDGGDRKPTNQRTGSPRLTNGVSPQNSVLTNSSYPELANGESPKTGPSQPTNGESPMVNGHLVLEDFPSSEDTDELETYL